MLKNYSLFTEYLSDTGEYSCLLTILEGDGEDDMKKNIHAKVL